MTPVSHGSTRSRGSPSHSSPKASNGAMAISPARADNSVSVDLTTEQWRSRTREAEENYRRLQQQQQRRLQQRAAAPPKATAPLRSNLSPLETSSSDSGWVRALQARVDRKRGLPIAERDQAMLAQQREAMANFADRQARTEARLVAMPHYFRKHILFTAIRRYVAIERNARQQGALGACGAVR